jgi:hypothetical protein
MPSKKDIAKLKRNVVNRFGWAKKGELWSKAKFNSLQYISAEKIIKLSKCKT